MKTKSKSSGFLRVVKLAAVMAMFAAPPSRALTVLFPPSFTASVIAPLAATLALTTDIPSQVSVSVTDGNGTWARNFYDYGTNHSEILLGFRPNQTNLITITVRDEYRNTFTYPQALSFISSPLPTNMPTFTLVTNIPALMEPGYTLFRVSDQTTGAAWVTIVDSSGEILWYGPAAGIGGTIGPIPTPSDVVQMTNGNLFFPETDTFGFEEANMLGQAVETWTAPTGYQVDSHEDLITDHGTILYLNYYDQVIPDFPTSATDPDAPTETEDVTCGRPVEISYTNSALLNSWSLIDMFDPVRINYLCFLIPRYGIDAEHANAVVDDTADNSLIVSMRNQDAVVKFTRSGVIKWILGPTNNWGAEWQPYLLKPVGTPFEWNYAEHAPILTPQGTLLMYDDGNCRTEPFDPPVPDQDNYSRAVEFSIDETNMEVSQVWQFSDTNSDRLYTSALGNASWLPKTSNVLVTFGFISYENGANTDPLATNATVVRLKEVTHTANPTVVFDLKISNPENTNTNSAGYEVYRSHRIPDLYSHLAVPVPNLTVQNQGGQPLLEFTADPVRTYVVQVSEDMINWTAIGQALPDDTNGDFSFQEASADQISAHFYRVLTQ
jgi:hypothetical protein